MSEVDSRAENGGEERAEERDCVQSTVSYQTLIVSPRIPAVGVEVFVGDRWRCLKRVPDNFFVGSGMGKVPFPLKVRLTSITGQQREATIKELKNDESLTSTVQFSGFKKKLGEHCLPFVSHFINISAKGFCYSTEFEVFTSEILCLPSQ